MKNSAGRIQGQLLFFCMGKTNSLKTSEAVRFNIVTFYLGEYVVSPAPPNG